VHADVANVRSEFRGPRAHFRYGRGEVRGKEEEKKKEKEDRGRRRV